MTDDQTTRAIELEMEVPGTPEQVWEAIATGPGISSWFVPATVEEREGGAVTTDFGSLGTEPGTVTQWEPGTAFTYASPEDRGGLAFQWLVEARDGGSCVVRLVNSGFGFGDDWDAQYDSMTDGWTLFLHALRLHLAHFPGDPAAPIIIHGQAAGAADDAWAAFAEQLGIPTSPAVGERIATSAPGVPALSGVVDTLLPGMVLVVLDGPAPGIAFLSAESWGETTAVSMYAYLHGPDRAAVAERETAAWQTWIDEHFPMPDPQAAAAAVSATATD